VIELVAPGVQIETTWPGGGYRQLTGNSFACPYITGIIALMLEARPDLTPFQIKTILYAIAQRNRENADKQQSTAQPETAPA
jgi:subtilisin family serine protease